MSKLQWDQAGERRYESGVDRGVLYLPGNSAVPWNGLTSVSINDGDAEVTPYYFDGVKYLDSRGTTDLSAVIKAMYYPDEFLPFDGTAEVQAGYYATNQPVYDTFGLSYRTGLANDLLGVDYGYKVHLLYNLTATTDSRTYNTRSKSPETADFSWTITGVPIDVPGCRPTAHIVLDSTKLPVNAMSAVEDTLYGTLYSPPSLPNVSVLAGLTQYGITAIIREPI